MALRRVTSASGWGEVCCVLTRVFNLLWFNASTFYDVSVVRACQQVEIGAGDTQGPLLGMKIFRNVTSRLYALKTRDRSIFYFFSFLLQPEQPGFNHSHFFILFLPQLRHSSVRAPVLIPRRAPRCHHGAGPPPRQEHHGLCAVALGNPVLYEHQHRQGHQEQPLHLRNAGMADTFNPNVSQGDVKNSSVGMGPQCLTLCLRSLAFLTRLR